MDILEKTRATYQKQHMNYLQDQKLFDRFYQMAVNPTHYGLNKEDINGANILDCGCGNSAYLQAAMHDLNAKSITCLDIGEEWIPILREFLESKGLTKERFIYKAGNVLDIPFEHEQFDIVFSNGVIMHLSSIAEAESALKELARVTKPGGYLYVYVGLGQGVIDKYILPAFRKAYQEEPNFKDFIDNISPEKFHSLFSFIENVSSDNSSSKENLSELKPLFDIDLCTFIQNVLQVPNQQGVDLTYEWACKQFENLGFEDVKQCPQVYINRQNIRKYFAPFHFDTKNPISQIFYGGSHVRVIGRKL